MSVRTAAFLFGALLAIVILFQLALALGAPWGAYAMGGVHPGVYPVSMRLAALAQAFVLGLSGLVMLARAGLLATSRPRAVGVLVWAVVALLGLSALLNLITPSAMERLIWAPVALLQFAFGLRIALSRPAT
jgi:hypothetical protein